MSIIKKHLYLLCLFVVVALACITNYSPNTWLTGWDNLHPEFNFPLNISRSFFALWQEYQGLGLLGGMAHASDLPRQLFLYLVSFVLPLSFLRYFYTFLMLFVGITGVYTLLMHKVLADQPSPRKERAAFFGSLFYLLNLGTIQYFFVPFEPYSTFWGMFPWEIYAAIRFIQSPIRKNLFFLAVVNIMAIPQAYVQTVFLVYVFCIGMLLATFFFAHRSKLRLWIAAKVLVVIFCVNAFWLLPNLYFTLTSVGTTQHAMNNEINNDRFVAMNKARGTIEDFPLLRGFYYDFLTFNPQTKKYDFMMNEWRKHYASPLSSLVGYAFFAVVLLGLLRKNKYRLFLVCLFLLSAVALLSDTPLFSFVNSFLRSVPLVNQIFRNPFTKFIVPAIFVCTICFSLGITRLFTLAENKKLARLPVFLMVVLLALFAWYSLPVWRGEFIAKGVRVTLPKEYFDMFSYFTTQDKNARIMNLPQGSYWGWGSYSWGVTGSGFLWYGIEQPILDRAFDVWSKPLEGYYWELWYALKKKDQRLFNQIIDKYQIAYIIYDPTYTPSDSNPFTVLYNQQGLLTNNPHVTLAKRFGPILVYKTNLSIAPEKNLLFGKGLARVKNSEPYSSEDTLFAREGFYFEAKDSKSIPSLTPFGSLFTNRFKKENTFRVTENKDTIAFSASLPKGKYQLSYPSLIAREPMIPIDMYARRVGDTLEFRFSVVTPTISLNGKKLQTDAVTDEIVVRLADQAKDASFIVGINNQEFFPLASTTTFTYVGNSYFFNAQGANTVRIYAMQDAETKKLPLENFSLNKECEVRKNPKSINTTVVNDALVLQAKNTSLCSMFTESLPIGNEQSLVQISFNYTSTSDEFPDYCLATAENHGCINTRKHYGSQNGFSNTERGFVDFLEIVTPISQASFQLILDATSEQDINQLHQITYKNVSLTKYAYLASISGDIGFAQKLLPDKKIMVDLPKLAELTVHLPKRTNSFSFPNLLEGNLYKKTPLTATNLPLTGEYHLQELHENKQKSLRVYAQNTHSQLWLNLLESEANFGYLLGLKTRNVSGFPFIVNAFTPSEGNKYVYTQLEKESTWQQNYYVLPPFYEFDKGLQILLMSSSFNKVPTINDVSAISIYPIPYTFLTGISLGAPLAKASEIIERPKDATKHNISLYEIPYPQKDVDAVILSQAYHEGWKAFTINSSQLTINKLLPFLFGKEIKNHVVVNNWENGWILGNECQMSNVNCQIVIVYLPQYLEYLGFMLGILCILGIAISLPYQRFKGQSFKRLP